MIRSPLMTVMVDSVMKAARSLRRDFGEVENLQVSRKGAHDFVTAADHKSEKILHEALLKARPDFGFVMEESGIVIGKDASHRWHIDPLDGTLNFLHGVPHFAISLGLEREGAYVAGVVYDPIKDELFIAEKGKGAFLNNRRLRVSGRTDMAEALMATGVSPTNRTGFPQFFKEVSAVMEKTSSFRRFGSAALDLAYVAAGRFEGYWEAGLNSWDVSAGVVLVREAGGFVTEYSGADFTPDSVSLIAGNAALHKSLTSTLATTR